MGTERLNFNQNEEGGEREEKQEREIQMEIFLTSSQKAFTCMYVCEEVTVASLM